MLVSNSNVCMQFMQNRLIKTSISLYKSRRGVRDLQLCFLPQGALQLEIFENNSVKVCEAELLGTLGAPERVSRAGVARRPRRGPAGPARRGQPTSAGPCAVGPTTPHRHPGPVSLPHVSRAHWPRRADHAARPLTSSSYPAVRAALPSPMLLPIPRRARGHDVV
jgi:hypothetical protein